MDRTVADRIAQSGVTATELHDALLSLVTNLTSGHSPAAPLEEAMRLLGRIHGEEFAVPQGDLGPPGLLDALQALLASMQDDWYDRVAFDDAVEVLQGYGRRPDQEGRLVEPGGSTGKGRPWLTTNRSTTLFN